jgi:uncharacterized protein YndB with AHSA1/START domain
LKGAVPAVVEEVAESIEIAAPPVEVFPFFLDGDLMVQWMGDTVVLDGQVGGCLKDLVEGQTIVGRFLEVDPPRGIRFSWGFEGSDSLNPEASEVDVRLSPRIAGPSSNSVTLDWTSAVLRSTYVAGITFSNGFGSVSTFSPDWQRLQMSGVSNRPSSDLEKIHQVKCWRLCEQLSVFTR